MKFSLIISLVLFGWTAVAQDKHAVDSLLAVVKAHPKDTAGFSALRELSIIHEDENDSMSYVYGHKALAFAKKINNEKSIAAASAQIGITCSNLGKVDSSIFYYNQAISIFKKFQMAEDLTIVNMNLGITYRQAGKLFDAINCFYEAIKYSEKVHDDELAGKSKMLLANAYRQKKDFNLAEKYYYESLVLAEKLKDKNQIAFLYNNIGLLNSDFKKHEKALEFFFKSLRIRDSLQLRKAYASTTENIACEYADMGEIQKSLKYHHEALTIYKELNDKKGIATTLINLAAVDTRQKKYEPAINGLLQAMVLAQEISHLDMLKEIYQALSQNYEESSKFQKALEFHKKYISLKDSILSDEESQQLIEMNTKYETEKKENQNKLLATQNELSQKTIKQQKTTTYFIIAALTLALLAAFFIFRNLKQQRKANKIISEQKREVEFQKELVEEHRKEVLDSIHYAKRIQNTLLAHHDFLDENLPQNFVFFKPKDIVSGDFYWATSVSGKQSAIGSDSLLPSANRDLFYLAVCDSTGHGVPGAFMSLLNIGFLNEAINEKNILEPHKIFDYVRRRLTESVSKEGQKDGFDGILMCFDKSANQITYAAAHNAPVLISGKTLEVMPRDKMPVGVGELQKDFSLYTLNVKPGDVIYLYTDGYADQFGGDKGKKFKYKQLDDLLLSIHEQPLVEQSKIVASKFEEWKGRLEQVDDVCIVAIKV